MLHQLIASASPPRRTQYHRGRSRLHPPPGELGQTRVAVAASDEPSVRLRLGRPSVRARYNPGRKHGQLHASGCRHRSAQRSRHGQLHRAGDPRLGRYWYGIACEPDACHAMAPRPGLHGPSIRMSARRASWSATLGVRPVASEPSVMASGPGRVTAHMPDAQVALLRAHGIEHTTTRDEVLFCEGDRTYDFLVIVAGSVAVVDGYGRAERELAVALPGDFVAELNLLTGERVYTTAVVREPGVVLRS